MTHRSTHAQDHASQTIMASPPFLHRFSVRDPLARALRRPAMADVRLSSNDPIRLPRGGGSFRKRVQGLPDRTAQSGTGATTTFQLSTALGTLSPTLLDDVVPGYTVCWPGRAGALPWKAFGLTVPAISPDGSLPAVNRHGCPGRPATIRGRRAAFPRSPCLPGSARRPG